MAPKWRVKGNVNEMANGKRRLEEYDMVGMNVEAMRANDRRDYGEFKFIQRKITFSNANGEKATGVSSWFAYQRWHNISGDEIWIERSSRNDLGTLKKDCIELLERQLQKQHEKLAATLVRFGEDGNWDPIK